MPIQNDVKQTSKQYSLYSSGKPVLQRDYSVVLSVFDHFVKLARKQLMAFSKYKKNVDDDSSVCLLDIQIV